VIFLPLDLDPGSAMQKKSRAGIRYKHSGFNIEILVSVLIFKNWALLYTGGSDYSKSTSQQVTKHRSRQTKKYFLKRLLSLPQQGFIKATKILIRGVGGEYPC
jgi:hypothetical protein